MIVSFDFGTQEHVDLRAVKMAFEKIFKEVEDCGLKAGRFSAYVNFFDEDGMLQDFARPSDGASIDIVVRKKPYKRKPSNVEKVASLNVEYPSTGEVETLATMYRKFTK